MVSRWRRRAGGLAILALAMALARGSSAAVSEQEPRLIVWGGDGEIAAEVALADGEFVLRYRNSVYRSLAEERYRLRADGSIELIGLAADELAVLEEYYAIDDPAWRAAESSERTWSARPSRPMRVRMLVVAATDLGRRTLLVAGTQPLPLWRLVDDSSPSVTIEAGRP